MRRFGLLGRTLKHSFSKGYFTDKFQQEQRTDCVYENFELDTIRAFPFLLEQHPDLEGLNVTIPFKRDVISFLHEQNEAVRAIGACNCIRLRNGQLEGFNTDYLAFQQSLQPLLRPQHKAALVLGTGGASAAVSYALQQLGISVILVSRSRSGDAIAYGDLDEKYLQEHTAIVNTTPLGTWPDVNACPDIPYHLLTPDHLLYDLVYNPERTLFLQKGAERGAAIKNGHEMLVLQAEASWEIWNRP